MSEERNHQPTARKRNEARQQGRVAASNILVGAIVWLGFVAAIHNFGQSAIGAIEDTIRLSWSTPVTNLNFHQLNVQQPLSDNGLVGKVAMLGFVSLSGILGLALLGRLAQTGFVWAPNRIGPNESQPSLGERLIGIFSFRKLAVAIRGLVASAALLTVMGFLLWHRRDAILQTMFATSPTLNLLQQLTVAGYVLGGVLLCLGLADYAYQRFEFEHSLRMTDQEVRAEVQAIRANDQIESGRRRLQQLLHQAEAVPAPSPNRTHAEGGS